MSIPEAIGVVTLAVAAVLAVAWHVIGWLLRRDLTRYETRRDIREWEQR